MLDCAMTQVLDSFSEREALVVKCTSFLRLRFPLLFYCLLIELTLLAVF